MEWTYDDVRNKRVTGENEIPFDWWDFMFMPTLLKY